MKRKKILKELGKYLPDVVMIELKLALSIKGDIGLCTTIAQIIVDYNSTQVNEDKVCELLSQLCTKHFKSPRLYKSNMGKILLDS